MKKTLWMLLLAAVTFSACCKKTAEIDNTDPNEVVFTASASVSAGTGDDAGFNYVWNADSDRIGLFATAGGAADHTNVYYAAFSSTEKSKFKSPSVNNVIRWKSEGGTRDFYAYYPFRTTAANPEAIPVSLAAQLKGTAGSSSHLKSASVMFASKEGAKQKDGDVDLQFKSIFGVVRLDICTTEFPSMISSVTLRSLDGETMAFGEGTLNIKNGNVAVKEESTSDNVKLTLSKTMTINTTPVSVYIPVYPGHAGKEFEVSAEVKGETQLLGTVTVPSTGIAAGVITIFPIEYDAPPAEITLYDKLLGTWTATNAGTELDYTVTFEIDEDQKSYKVIINRADLGESHPLIAKFEDGRVAIWNRQEMGTKEDGTRFISAHYNGTTRENPGGVLIFTIAISWDAAPVFNADGSITLAFADDGKTDYIATSLNLWNCAVKYFDFYASGSGNIMSWTELVLTKSGTDGTLKDFEEWEWK